LATCTIRGFLTTPQAKNDQKAGMETTRDTGRSNPLSFVTNRKPSSTF
jgi:hypothetical protein